MGDPLISDPDGLTAGISQLISGEHHDPHGLLGRHEADGDTVVRALRPSATAMRILVADGGQIDMEQVHEDGLFSAVAPQAAAGYRLEADYPTGLTATLGEVDVHLLGEGKHRRLWRVLGAHPREIDGVAGTSFAVWAPNARSVRVVGEFNLWDGRLHPMRSLGSSGIWELFCRVPAPGRATSSRSSPAPAIWRLRPTPWPSPPKGPPPPTAS
jgi:1,4-alpha-glucan branching enzyme